MGKASRVTWNADFSFILLVASVSQESPWKPSVSSCAWSGAGAGNAKLFKAQPSLGYQSTVFHTLRQEHDSDIAGLRSFCSFLSCSYLVCCFGFSFCFSVSHPKNSCSSRAVTRPHTQYGLYMGIQHHKWCPWVCTSIDFLNVFMIFLTMINN